MIVTKVFFALVTAPFVGEGKKTTPLKRHVLFTALRTFTAAAKVEVQQ